MEFVKNEYFVKMDRNDVVKALEIKTSTSSILTFINTNINIVIFK